MKQDKFGYLIFNENDVIENLMSSDEVPLYPILIDFDTKHLKDINLNKKIIKNEDLNISVEELDKINQQDWLMPLTYKEMDIAKYILDLCKTQEELQRCGEELLLYTEHNLLDLLRYLKYLVDVMEENNIIWGVGRGSSVSSYVLYKLKVHKIDSMYYDLDVKEFLR